MRDLYKAYVARLHNPTDTGTLALVLAAAELVISAEQARADLLAGRGDLDAVVRIENLAARALRRLGLGKPAPKPAGPTLQDITAKYSGPAVAQNGAEALETPALVTIELDRMAIQRRMHIVDRAVVRHGDAMDALVSEFIMVH
jgi:hypothetical protein